MSWLSHFFGGQSMGSNPADSAMPYLDKIKGEYSDPSMYNTIAGQYKQSPGYQFRLKQAMTAGDNAAASSGMLGTGQHQFNNMATAEGLANQDYNDWWNQRMGLNQDMGSILGKKGELSYLGQQNQNQQHAQAIQQLLSLLGIGGGVASSFFSGK